MIFSMVVQEAIQIHYCLDNASWTSIRRPLPNAMMIFQHVLQIDSTRILEPLDKNDGKQIFKNVDDKNNQVAREDR